MTRVVLAFLFCFCGLVDVLSLTLSVRGSGSGGEGEGEGEGKTSDGSSQPVALMRKALPSDTSLGSFSDYSPDAEMSDLSLKEKVKALAADGADHIELLPWRDSDEETDTPSPGSDSGRESPGADESVEALLHSVATFEREVSEARTRRQFLSAFFRARDEDKLDERLLTFRLSERKYEPAPAECEITEPKLPIEKKKWMGLISVESTSRPAFLDDPGKTGKFFPQLKACVEERTQKEPAELSDECKELAFSTRRRSQVTHPEDDPKATRLFDQPGEDINGILRSSMFVHQLSVTLARAQHEASSFGKSETSLSEALQSLRALIVPAMDSLLGQLDIPYQLPKYTDEANEASASPSTAAPAGGDVTSSWEEFERNIQTGDIYLTGGLTQGSRIMHHRLGVPFDHSGMIVYLYDILPDQYLLGMCKKFAASRPVGGLGECLKFLQEPFVLEVLGPGGDVWDMIADPLRDLLTCDFWHNDSENPRGSLDRGIVCSKYGNFRKSGGISLQPLWDSVFEANLRMIGSTKASCWGTVAVRHLRHESELTKRLIKRVIMENIESTYKPDIEQLERCTQFADEITFGINAIQNWYQRKTLTWVTAPWRKKKGTAFFCTEYTAVLLKRMGTIKSGVTTGLMTPGDLGKVHPNSLEANGYVTPLEERKKGDVSPILQDWLRFLDLSQLQQEDVAREEMGARPLVLPLRLPFYHHNPREPPLCTQCFRKANAGDGFGTVDQKTWIESVRAKNYDELEAAAIERRKKKKGKGFMQKKKEEYAEENGIQYPPLRNPNAVVIKTFEDFQKNTAAYA